MCGIRVLRERWRILGPPVSPRMGEALNHLCWFTVPCYAAAGNLAFGCRRRRLSGFDKSAGDFPVLLVARAYEEHAAFFVEEEGACGDARGCHGWHLVGRHQGSLDALGLVDHLEPPRQADQFSRRLASLDRAAAIELEMNWVP